MSIIIGSVVTSQAIIVFPGTGAFEIFKSTSPLVFNISDLTDQIIHFLLYIKLIYTCNFEVILVYSLN